ncbi:hypothetical protein N9S60_00020 [bacterium]|nr:hypothetical protein [bacterium]
MYLTKLLEKVIGNTNNENISLHQGSNYNGMQNKIISGVVPELINEGSIVESLDNMGSNPLNVPTPTLHEVDKSEFADTKKMEDEFSKKLAEYTAAYKEFSENALRGNSCIPNSRAIAYNVRYRKNNRRYYGSNGYPFDRYCNYPSVKKQCKSNYWCQEKSRKNTNDNLELLNAQLMELAKRLQNRSQKLHTTDVKLQRHIAEKNGKLNKNIQTLDKQRQQFIKLSNSQNTLYGNLQDNKMQNNAVFMHYMVWVVAASTIGVVAVHQALK